MADESHRQRLVDAVDAVLRRSDIRRRDMAAAVVDDPGVMRAIAGIAAVISREKAKRQSCKCAFCPHCRKDHVNDSCAGCPCKGEFI